MLTYTKNVGFTIMIYFLLIAFVWPSASEKENSTLPHRENLANQRVNQLIQKGKQLIKTWNYDKALKVFQKAHRLDPKNPDVLSLLAYSQRKLGLLDEAFVNYKKALEIKPDFAEAREYLGEAYLQAALREVKILRTYGENGEKELQKLIDTFKKTIEKL